MIEIRTYNGEATELSNFTQKAWRGAYEGRMPFPLWSPRYIDWQLLAERPEGREYLVAAYDGSKLVGCLLAEGFRCRLHDREFDATLASWLTVHPDYQRQGIGTRLFQEQRRRHLERGALLMFGYIYIATALSAGPKFWLSFPDHTVVLDKVGFWARMLAHAGVAQWELSRGYALMVRALGLFQRPPQMPLDPAGIRAYRPDDLDAGLALAHQTLERTEMAYLWSPQRLARQLEHHGVSSTMVAEQVGQVAGFVNYHRMDFLARWPMEAGIIDLIAFGRLGYRERRRLLSAVLHQMQEEKLKVALLLRPPSCPVRTLLAADFVPMAREFYLIAVRMDPSFRLERPQRWQMHWR